MASRLNRLSVKDFWRYHDSGVNWRIPEGYGTLIAALGAGLDVMRNCPATLVDATGARLRIETPRGSLRATAAIIAIPTDVMCSGSLQFRPELPGKMEAAAALPLGVADKLFLRLDGAEEFAKDSRLMGTTESARTGAYHMRPFGRPMIEAYFGGALARELEAEGLPGFAAYAADELSARLGAGIRKRIHPIAASSWARDPHARGSYSHALPGLADARGVLAAPVEGGLFFAGEACSEHDFSTTHGAWRTGLAAANAVLAALATASV